MNEQADRARMLLEHLTEHTEAHAAELKELSGDTSGGFSEAACNEIESAAQALESAAGHLRLAVQQLQP